MEKNNQWEEKKQEIEKAFWKEAEKVPGPAFSREELAIFLGISTGYLANLDSKGEGPEGGVSFWPKKNVSQISCCFMGTSAFGGVTWR